MTSIMMLRAFAPNAMRTPISWVRLPVACAITAYKPIEAISSAIPANPEKSL